MTTEEPLFKKCCFVISLRLCLQTWAFIKLASNILAISYLVIVTAILYGYEHEGFFKELCIYHGTALLVVALLVDVGFLITSIVGVFRKSIKILRVIFFYEFYAITVETVVILILLVNLYLIESFSEDFFYAILGFLYIALDVCICITLQSEMVKLRNKEQYNFSKMGGNEGTGKFQLEE